MKANVHSVKSMLNIRNVPHMCKCCKFIDFAKEYKGYNKDCRREIAMDRFEYDEIHDKISLPELLVALTLTLISLEPFILLNF